jgi:hypothetical protein
MSALQGRAAPAQRAFASRPVTRATRILLTIAALTPGLWTVSSSDGCVGGTFISYKAALTFARTETMARPNAALVVCGAANGKAS